MDAPTPPTANRLRALAILAAIVLLLMAAAVTVGGILLTNAHRDATGLIVLGATVIVPTAGTFANYALGIKTHAAAASASNALNGSFDVRVMQALENVLSRHLSEPASDMAEPASTDHPGGTSDLPGPTQPTG